MAAVSGPSALVSTFSVRTGVRIPATPQNVSFSCLNNSPRMRLQRSCSVSVRAVTQAVDVSKVVPQADRVLIRLEEIPEKSAGGVLLPKSAVKFERYLMGEVVSVGSEAGDIEKGKKVLFSDINAYEVNLGTPEKMCFCRVGDLMAVVE
uniref:TSA: Wollemia nobilis Ref_Wollemi_Transcript_11394_732 transcribed RNA sequence n=1 Tax=Wollemia nobilis TaxID=56998 RepID=A0A0C9RV65_9CONI